MKASELVPRAWIGLLNPATATAFALSYLDSRARSVQLTVPQSPVRFGQLAHNFWTESSVTNALHLAGVRVRAQGGKECPQGKLEIRIDQRRLLWGKLPSFEKDRDASDYPWKATEEFFLAVEMIGKTADPKQKLGFMLPHGTHVEVWIEVEPLKESLTLEVDLILNLYDAATKKERDL